ncbi:MAG: hypothetical protein ACFE9L_05240 [Candidatus Hodarchaeota archaeon]
MAVIVWFRDKYTAETHTHLLFIKDRPGENYQLKLNSTTATPGIPIDLDQGAKYRELAFTRKTFDPPIAKSSDSIGESALDYLINIIEINGNMIIYPLDTNEEYPDLNTNPQLTEGLDGASIVSGNNTPDGYDIRIFWDISPRGKHFYLPKRIQEVSRSSRPIVMHESLIQPIA